MTKTLLRGARLFADPRAGACDLLVEAGTIRTIAPAGTLAEPRADVRDVTGLLAMPGLIDAHVHPIHEETFATVGNAAVHGGITTVCNHLYPRPAETFREAIERMREDGSRGTADFAAHVRWDPSRRGEDLAELATHGALSIKVFLAHPDKHIQSTLDDLVTAMSQAAAAGVPTLVHAELGSVIDSLLAEGHASAPDLSGLHAWRSPFLEAAAVTGAAAVALATGAHLYVVHVSSQQAADACERARRAGVNISIETCPHYLFLTHATAPAGGRGFVLPPLRETQDLTALRRALTDGVVDTVASDHCGHGAASKVTDIGSSKAGLPGIETLAGLLIDAALGEDAWLSPSRVVDVLCAGPARVFGIVGKGALAPGHDGDITFVDPSAVTHVDKAHLHDAADYSPYQGRRLQGAIAQVWRRGALVVDAGRAMSTGQGRLVGTSRHAPGRTPSQVAGFRRA